MTRRMDLSENENTANGFPDVKEIETLYVQTAGGMTYENGNLTQNTISPTTLLLSDRV